MKKKRKKIVIAAGGTGGHLFPAQTLASELQKEGIDVIFMGAGLNSNRYFDRDKYAYCDIPSGTVFRRNILLIFKSLFHLVKGVKHSFKLLKKEEPDLIIGFGSFHSFPILCAARLQKKTVALFESNAYPGKVNRLFSSGAAYTAVVFPKAQDHLNGKIVEVAMPVRQAHHVLPPEAATGYFGLDPRYPILLIFGGSQGALAMNELFVKSIELLKPHNSHFQVIHITGQPEVVDTFKETYASLKIRACVKGFETNMATAYQAASFAVCRAGAATISELIAHEVPSILIPFPFAADDHQAKNAQFFHHEVKGGVHLPEKGLTKEVLAMEIYRFLDPAQSTLRQMRQSINTFKSSQDKKQLCTLICETLNLK
ncbi:MAG: undecaprenyldiphospho-muramoylpentapeptide beta-N-acetylglucosaminyltransferase [Verrucomicrobia bacterium]|nr:undecaprenyldiphospho-muramoylpentapeptide beta-N-acetylglucosaminyltransferase [Verrucomicrobiota bacterium]